MLRSLLSLLFVNIGLCCFAQKNIDDALAKEEFFRGVAVGVDVVGPAMLLLSDCGEYQVTATANLKGTFFPTIELGYGKSDHVDDLTNNTYKAKTPFFRVGCDYNFLKDKNSDYRFYGGLRYAMTPSFDYEGVKGTAVQPSDPSQSSTIVMQPYSSSMSLHWAEIVFGVDAKLFGPIHMGWSFRYRKRLNTPDFVGAPDYVPGYGLPTEETRIMALYTVSVEL